MPITEIIHEIDAYLSILRQARNLLATPLTKARSKGSQGGKKKAKDSAELHHVAVKPAIHKSKSRSGPLLPAAELTGELVDSSLQTPSPVAHLTPEPKPPMLAATRIVLPEIDQDMLSAKRKSPPARGVRRSFTRTVTRAKPDAPKPAIALAGIKDFKVVVVSADQLKREREQVVKPEVRPRRMPSTGLTGKLAFEALFKDTTDPSKPQGQ